MIRNYKRMESVKKEREEEHGSFGSEDQKVWFPKRRRRETETGEGTKNRKIRNRVVRRMEQEGEVVQTVETELEVHRPVQESDQNKERWTTDLKLKTNPQNQCCLWMCLVEVGGGRPIATVPRCQQA